MILNKAKSIPSSQKHFIGVLKAIGRIMIISLIFTQSSHNRYTSFIHPKFYSGMLPPGGENQEKIQVAAIVENMHM